ncbi:hypothetical protein PP754_gp033 [Pectobacterium phage Possum]|uniref:Uncharacterized protein n=1 Tax=Pectobacterium phage Possum TaxID=2686301 RepID=A0A7T0LVN5_9CAUD|nr:hypothetical protein PP754_gp033 [Pectobacterium phage Possum]QPL10874.1 hypothetical protein Possum_00033 [Pectobacterium phage Possum]QPL10976.1 hypothetical protein Horatius_00033 [Pectobacterium phage Horatius]
MTDNALENLLERHRLLITQQMQGVITSAIAGYIERQNVMEAELKHLHSIVVAYERGYGKLITTYKNPKWGRKRNEN